MVYNKLKEAGYTDIQRQYFEVSYTVNQLMAAIMLCDLVCEQVATYEESGESSLSATITVNNQDYTFEFTRASVSPSFCNAAYSYWFYV